MGSNASRRRGADPRTRVSASDAYARIVGAGVAAIETSEVAALLKVSLPAASMLLAGLATTGLMTRLRTGLWAIDRARTNRYALAETVTAPMPSYVSLQTALYLHGMIEQVPSVVYVVSLARTRVIRTSIATYSVHHLAPELFDGFKALDDGTKLATPEKALFDVVYLSGGRSRLFARLPELELPKSFKEARLQRWVAKIDATRRRSMVAARIQYLIGQARERAASQE